MSDTLGGLVDKLITVNTKLWFSQDSLHKYAQEGVDAFSGHPHHEIHEVLKRVADLNLQRNRLMTQIDRCLADAVERGAAEVDSRIKLV